MNKPIIYLNFYDQKGKGIGFSEYESHFPLDQKEKILERIYTEALSLEGYNDMNIIVYVRINTSPDTRDKKYFATLNMREEIKKRNRDNILEDALLKHGPEKQIDMWFEESSELTQALCKIKRLFGIVKYYKKDHYIYKPGKETEFKYTMAYYHLCGEVADTKIILGQIEKMLDQTTIDLIEERKLMRLKDRLDKGIF